MTHSTQKALFSTAPAGIEKFQGKELRFEIRGFHIPSFKNSKMILGIRKQPNGDWKGTPFIATKTDYKNQMKEITQSLLSQLISASQTIAEGTLTEPQARSLIAWLMPQDDSRQWIPDLRVTCEKVDAGNEGATITVRRIV